MVILNINELKEALPFLMIGVETGSSVSQRAKNIYIREIENELFFYVSTDNVSIAYKVENYTKQDFNDEISVGFDAKKLFHIVENTRKDELKLKPKKNEERITWVIHGSGRYALQNFPIEFDDMFFKEELKNKLFSVGTSRLVEAMEKSTFFLSEERQDPHFRNFLFDTNLVSTNRKSLNIIRNIEKFNSKILIPQVMLEVCRKFEDESLEVYDQESYYLITNKKKTYTIRMPKLYGADKFPDYEEFVNKCSSYKYYFTVKVEDLQPVLKLLSFFTDPTFFYGIEITISKENITFRVHTNDDLEEKIPCKSNVENDIRIKVNSKYLENLLEGTSSETLTIRFESPELPVFIELDNRDVIISTLYIKEYG